MGDRTQRRDNTPTTSQTTTQNSTDSETRTESPRVLRLRGGIPRAGGRCSGPRTWWTMKGSGGRAPRAVDESSDESSSDDSSSSSDSDSDSGADDKKRSGDAKKTPAPNAYEKVPKHKPKEEQAPASKA
ncbi:hypothetical protein ACCO45_005219 [Purpureocillium lilacinum]|uniref:Uncharacterized protein n=1 Tax=Purpureocillium lilacinum TaxID=33203 RepID=A0ACC4DVI1_PURLI